MIKHAVIFILFFLAICGSASASKSDDCRTTSKWLGEFAKSRDKGVAIQDVKKVMRDVARDESPAVQNAYLSAIDNVYHGKLKGLSPSQVELVHYNVCMGTMLMP